MFIQIQDFGPITQLPCHFTYSERHSVNRSPFLIVGDLIGAAPHVILVLPQRNAGGGPDSSYQPTPGSEQLPPFCNQRAPEPVSSRMLIGALTSLG